MHLCISVICVQVFSRVIACITFQGLYVHACNYLKVVWYLFCRGQDKWVMQNLYFSLNFLSLRFKSCLIRAYLMHVAYFSCIIFLCTLGVDQSSSYDMHVDFFLNFTLNKGFFTCNVCDLSIIFIDHEFAAVGECLICIHNLSL